MRAIWNFHQIWVTMEKMFMKWAPELCSTFTRAALFALPCYNRLVAQIPQCTRSISHNAPFCNRNVHISVTRWCSVGYSSNALWDSWDGPIECAITRPYCIFSCRIQQLFCDELCVQCFLGNLIRQGAMASSSINSMEMAIVEFSWAHYMLFLNVA